MMRLCNFAKYMLKENTNEYKLYMYYEQLSKGNGIYNYCIIGNDKVVKTGVSNSPIIVVIVGDLEHIKSMHCIRAIKIIT